MNPITIRTDVSIALHHQWGIWQLDVDNSFPNSHLIEAVYMAQPSGKRDPEFPNVACVRLFMVLSNHHMLGTKNYKDLLSL